MPTYAYPTRSKLLNTATVATLEDALFEEAIPQGYTRALLCQLVLRNTTEPGLRVQGSKSLKLGDFMVKTKTMGGTRAEVFVDFESGVSAQSFRGLQTLSTAIGDGPTVSHQDWAYYTCYAAIAGTESVENTGAMKRLDIEKDRQNREVRGMIRLMEADLQGANTDIAAGTQDDFSGLQHKVATDPTSSTVVQGLNQSTFTPWRNVYDASVGSWATGGLDALRGFYFDLAGTNAAEPPHLYMTTSTVAGWIVKDLEGIHRLVGNLNGSDLSASQMPTHMGVPIVHTDDAQSGAIRAFNFDYLENCIHEGANWKVVSPGEPNDQWVKGQTRRVFGASPLMVTRREKFGVLAGITA